MTERDTHFQEFAELLRRDLSEIIDGPLVQSSANFEEFQQKIDHVKLILAQRAYDLAYHILDNMWAVHNPVWVIEKTPDITKWPEKPEEERG